MPNMVQGVYQELNDYFVTNTTPSNYESINNPLSL
jgi:hypothetical protein